MKLSIVMPYHNRMQQLELTLKSIRRQDQDAEVIIVDDGSDKSQRAREVVQKFPELDIKEIFLPEESRTWINPCIPFNIGIRKARGEIIILQSPECLHVGETLEFAKRNISPHHYLTFSCYNLPESSHSILKDYISLSDSNLDEAMKAHVPLNSRSTDFDTRRGDGCWFNHPAYCPKNYHFLSAMIRENMEDLGGFDERYAKGYCWDDNELLWRIYQKGLIVETIPPSQGFAVHQWHGKGSLSGACPEWHRNKNLFENTTKKSDTYKVNR